MQVFRLALIFVSAVVLAWVQAGGGAPPSAEGSFPGANGKIAFISNGPSNHMATILDDGTEFLDIGPGLAPAWSADGSRLAFSNGDILVMNEDGTGVANLTNGQLFGAHPDWSPEGDKIVFWNQSGGDGGLFIVGVDGTGLHRLTPPDLRVHTGGSWSPDGSLILFSVFMGDANRSAGAVPAGYENYDLFTIHPDGTGVTQITNTPDTAETEPDWSPDGSGYLFIGQHPSAPTMVEVAQASGATSTAIAEGFAADWSPDGSQIVYSTNSQNGAVLNIANANGSGAHFLVDGRDPSWQPVPAVIHGVEFTQGIQELQTVSGLQADIAGDGEPPVPLVAGKPAAMRIYFDEVDQATDYMAEVTGEVSDTAIVALTPGCTPTDRRRQAAGCSSVDFFFTPPTGSWSVRLVVKDISNVVVLDKEFDLTSVDMPELDVEYLPVCVRVPPAVLPTCPSNFISGAAPDLMQTLFPIADGDLHYSRFPVPPMVLTAPMLTFPEEVDLAASLLTRYNLMALGGFAPDQLAGWVPPGAAVHSGLSDPVWLGGTGRVSWVMDQSATTDLVTPQYTLVHEVGHNLGLRHVNLPDGCGAIDPATDWAFADSTIQEVGFDVAAGQAVPASKKDVMSYCTPPGTNVWISPFAYNKIVQGAFVPQRVGSQGSPNPYLVVKGSAQADGSAATIDSAYVITSNQPASQPNPLGNYCLRTTGGAQLDYCFMLNFKEHRSGDPLLSESFSLRIPLPEGTTRVSLTEGFQELDALELSASAPTVEITDPGELNGEETIEWSASDGDGDPLKYALMYSPDNGQTWYPIEVDATDTEFTFDTSVLEGDEVLIRVLASDGLNTTSETTGPVTVIHGEERTWGDNNCSGEADPVDSLLTLRFDAGLSANTGVCPELGATISAGGVSRLWGDIDCSGDVGPVDGLKLLRFDSGLSVAQGPGCPELGAPVNVSVAALTARGPSRQGTDLP